MFTGIIEEVGRIRQIRHSPCILTVEARHILEDVHIGDSIAVNGTCLTVCRFSADSTEPVAVGNTCRSCRITI